MKNVSTHGQVNSQEIHVYSCEISIKALKLTAQNISMLKFSKFVKVTESNLMIPTERSTHKEYSSKISGSSTHA